MLRLTKKIEVLNIQISKHFGKIINCITIILLIMVMLSFLGVIPFDLRIIPIIYGLIFIIYYLIIHTRLYDFFAATQLLQIAFLVSITYDKVLLNNGLYQYHQDFSTFVGMPIAAILIWSAAIFQAYHFNTGALYALQLDKPVFTKKEFSKLLLLMIADGFHLMTIGLTMEYWIVKFDFGTWLITANNEYFELPIFYVLMSYFIVGFLGSGLFRIVEFFRNKAIIPTFSGYKNIFGLVYLVCFLISLWVLIDVNFSPIFVTISIIMLSVVIVNDRIYKRRESDKN